MPNLTKLPGLISSLLVALFISLSNNSTALASPTQAESEAAQSPLIVVAEYLSPTVPLETLEKYPGSVLYMAGVVSKYKIEKILKAQAGLTNNKIQPGAIIQVHQIFHDFSNTTQANSWKFSSSCLPASGSKWILFLNENSKASMYETYRGSIGRWEATGQNLSRVSSLLASPPTANTAKPAASY